MTAPHQQTMPFLLHYRTSILNALTNLTNLLEAAIQAAPSQEDTPILTPPPQDQTIEPENTSLPETMQPAFLVHIAPMGHARTGGQVCTPLCLALPHITVWTWHSLLSA